MKRKKKTSFKDKNIAEEIVAATSTVDGKWSSINHYCRVLFTKCHFCLTFPKSVRGA